MDASKVRDLRQLVKAWQKDPASLIADPNLAFFRDYLQSLGAEIPTFNKPKGKSKAARGKAKWKEQSSSRSSGIAMPEDNLWANMKETDEEKELEKDESYKQAYALIEQERVALEQVRVGNEVELKKKELQLKKQEQQLKQQEQRLKKRELELKSKEQRARGISPGGRRTHVSDPILNVSQLLDQEGGPIFNVSQLLGRRRF